MNKKDKNLTYLILLSPLFILYLFIAFFYVFSAYFLSWIDYLINDDKKYNITLERYIDKELREI